jgi:hypothetical protein
MYFARREGYPRWVVDRWRSNTCSTIRWLVVNVGATGPKRASSQHLTIPCPTLMRFAAPFALSLSPELAALGASATASRQAADRAL